MGIFSHKVRLPSTALATRREADEQLEKSKRDLEEAKSLTEDLRSIRADNHFARDWRKALGK
jgi:hypothetical protein